MFAREKRERRKIDLSLRSLRLPLCALCVKISFIARLRKEQIIIANMPKHRRKTPKLEWLRFGGHDSRLSGVIFFLLCAIPVVSVVGFGAVDAWALGLLSLAAGVIVILWLADAWLKREFSFSTNKLLLPLLGLILLGLIQLLPLGGSSAAADLLSIPAAASLSLNAFETRFAVIHLIIYFIFFAAALTFINSLKRLKIAALTVIVAGAAMAFYGVLQELSGSESIFGVRTPYQANPFASFVNRHHFAAFMELTGGLTLGLLFGGAIKTDRRIFLAIAAVIMGIALILTSSRGGWLSFLVVLGLVIFAKFSLKGAAAADGSGSAPTFRQNAALVGGGLGLILILLLSVVWLGGDESLLRGVAMQNAQADVSNGRFHFWQIALKIFLDHPVIGAGLNSFGTAFPRYDTWHGYFSVEQAHNDYLQILADGGILGFLCVAAFVFLLFKNGLRVINKTPDPFRRSIAVGALAGCCGILFHSFFDFPLRTPSNALFFLLLAALILVEIKGDIHKRMPMLKKI